VAVHEIDLFGDHIWPLDTIWDDIDGVVFLKDLVSLQKATAEQKAILAPYSGHPPGNANDMVIVNGNSGKAVATTTVTPSFPISFHHLRLFKHGFQTPHHPPQCTSADHERHLAGLKCHFAGINNTLDDISRLTQLDRPFHNFHHHLLGPNKHLHILCNPLPDYQPLDSIESVTESNPIAPVSTAVPLTLTAIASTAVSDWEDLLATISADHVV